MDQRHQPQLAAPVQNAQKAGVIQVYALIDGVELDALQPQALHPGELLLPVGGIGVHTAEGEDARLGIALVYFCGGIVDVADLGRVGGHGQDDGPVHPRPGHGGGQIGVGAVGEGA